MDPNETLRQIRQAIQRANAVTGAYSQDEFHAEMASVPELFEALDEWIQSGGFLPADWLGNRKLITPEQAEVVAEALGDAYAYRTDSGEDAVEDLEDHEAAACYRYERLASELGVQIP